MSLSMAFVQFPIANNTHNNKTDVLKSPAFLALFIQTTRIRSIRSKIVSKMYVVISCFQYTFDVVWPIIDLTYCIVPIDLLYIL